MTKTRIAAATIALGFISGAGFAAPSAPAYTAMAPAQQYMMANAKEEIALAKSAAPPSISDKAEILVLGAHGYETAVKGTNGFVCLVERSWDAGFGDPVFWNPTIRGADCLNPEAARSMLPHFRERAGWALAGVSKAEMIAKTKAELAANSYAMPGAGAMAFMLSKDQRLANNPPHWHPHLMFFIVNGKDAAWGANAAGSPVMSSVGNDVDPVTTFFVPVGRWSDGTQDDMPMK